MTSGMAPAEMTLDYFTTHSPITWPPLSPVVDISSSVDRGPSNQLSEIGDLTGRSEAPLLWTYGGLARRTHVSSPRPDGSLPPNSSVEDK